MMTKLSGAVCSRPVLGALGLLALMTSVGCQVDVGGQTLPSPYWMFDDVQYFPPGPEFKLSREAAAMKAFERQQGLPPTAMTPAEAIAPDARLPVPVDVDAEAAAEGIAP